MCMNLWYIREDLNMGVYVKMGIFVGQMNRCAIVLCT